ncbi:hypothetical protein [Dinghuibacter silviterrae]|uniref:Uncharacterized protein n=1 Tax=Dinghuibacter silviterrae TaxID=1539049 RepID=A0A4R8DVS5_9BACT|nr:hypothetical protein [Dinghuibacter silviterrae]TDX02028.1 hypothetical protein EDB95_3076 [Dinghuibacter silviterrae]
MSENEIVKHLEVAYKNAKNPHTPWLVKLREILIEVLIIVFAVTISIWFHNWSDSLHEQKEEREFLQGLRQDIQTDMDNARTGRDFYKNAVVQFDYFIRVGKGMPLDQDSLIAYGGAFFNTTDLDPNVSRYEGLKGSGKFGIIRNKALLDEVISLHENQIKRVENLNRYYYEYVMNVSSFVRQHAILNQAGTAIEDGEGMLRLSEMRFLVAAGKSFITGNVNRSYDTCIATCTDLTKKIDEELQ